MNISVIWHMISCSLIEVKISENPAALITRFCQKGTDLPEHMASHTIVTTMEMLNLTQVTVL